MNKNKAKVCFVLIISVILLSSIVLAQTRDAQQKVDALKEAVRQRVADTQAQETKTQDEGGLANIIKLVALIFLLAIVLAVVLLIFFGLWKWIKFLFFKRNNNDEEKEDEGQRKLSAIMFTDMKGYSAEMSKDEDSTLKKVWRYEKAIKSIIKDNRGRVVKTIGDSLMGDFNSTLDAVTAAIDIQKFLKKEDITIRIGVHIGDVVHKAGDIFGEGVNIASRLESICDPGSIFISEDVYNQVKNKIKANFKSLGARPLKNIESPPRVYKIGD